jgi:hypothetical protein
MSEQIMELRVQIVRFVMEQWPSIVEWGFIDADGRFHTFIGKDAMCSEASLDPGSAYPQPGGVGCDASKSRVGATRKGENWFG